MRILLLVHGFNSLSQRLHVELARDGHELSVEFDIHDDVTLEAVRLFRPDVIVAPFLKRPIPPAVWRRQVCLIVHPGPPGDRGPAALDWAILGGAERWGVTVLQATGELDAGPIWASVDFAMRDAPKSSLYRNEVTESAVTAVRAALARLGNGERPVPQLPAAGSWRPALRKAQRAIDWGKDTSASILRKIHSADGYPGVEDVLLGRRFRLFDAHRESRLSGAAGDVIARRDEAICRATVDGAIWIGQLQPVVAGVRDFKRPAALALGALIAGVPSIDADDDDHETRREIRYVEHGAVGYLHFDFHNGALSAAQCRRLRSALDAARKRPTRVIVLMGGTDFWSNGMHLHCIEAADSPADASWENINAIDDLARDILTTDTQLTIAAMHGNAGAGGVFLALAADAVLARRGVILNPHYRNMGNLFGSEYWTWLLPERLGQQGAHALMASRLPIGTDEALALGLIDAHAGPARRDFAALVGRWAEDFAATATHTARLEAKRARRNDEEFLTRLDECRAGELERMRLNFYGFDPSYHIARYRFVNRTPHAWTPLYLAAHRRTDFVAPSTAEPA
jgi:putative two-component system protein, hydrogenase maturation factor HypX/HoxX